MAGLGLIHLKEGVWSRGRHRNLGGGETGMVTLSPELLGG